MKITNFFQEKRQLTVVLNYDLETINMENTIPYANNFFPVPKKKAIYDRGLTIENFETCQNNTLVMKDEDCFSQVFEYSKLSLIG